MSNRNSQPIVVLEPSEATVGQLVVIKGQGFPKTTAVFVVILNPSVLLPSLLVETDRDGLFVTSTSFQLPGEYTFSACFWRRRRWDCASTPHELLIVT